MFPLLALIPALLEGAAKIGMSWMEKKKVEAQGKVDIAKARVDGQIMLTKTQMEGDQAYDVKVAEDMGGSWKDEWFVILLSIPAVLCFINDSWAQHVLKGFQALAQAPDWYKWSFVGAIIASFGLKSLVRPMLNKWFGGGGSNGSSEMCEDPTPTQLKPAGVTVGQ